MNLVPAPLAMGPMTEVLFYHLERRPLEQVLPQLLEKTLERGWRAVVQTSSDERAQNRCRRHCGPTARTPSCPTARRRTASEEMQPIYPHGGREANPNGAQIRFFVDGAAARRTSPAMSVRCTCLTGNDEERRRRGT